MHDTLEISIIRLSNALDLPLPAYHSSQAAAMDLAAAVTDSLTINSKGTIIIPCGFAVAIPEGYEGQIRARSGLAANHGIIVTNAPGTVDSDYRGELKVILTNLGEEPFTISRGMRIAQLVVAPVVRATWKIVDALPRTDRGEGGFGHTGN